MLLQNNGFDCLEEEWKIGHRAGIAEGLRMAAEMLRERRWKAFKDGVPITDFEVYSRIIAKSKDVEEGK